MPNTAFVNQSSHVRNAAIQIFLGTCKTNMPLLYLLAMPHNAHEFLWYIYLGLSLEVARVFNHVPSRWQNAKTLKIF